MQVLGIDAGGTHTRARFAVDGHTIADAQVPGGNILTEGDAAVRARLGALLQALGSPVVQAVCIGAAGSGSPAGKRKVQAAMSQLLPVARVLVVHDARLVLAAGGMWTGIALVSGTGSSAYGRAADGRESIAGGWGYILGDEGSGFWIARAGVRQVLQAHDAGQPTGVLAELLMCAFDVRSPRELLPLIYTGEGPSALAGHADVVFAAAEAGDTAAQSIIAEAVVWLRLLVETVSRGVGTSAPVILAGGILQNQVVLETKLREELAACLPDSTVMRLEMPPVAGAVYLAEQLLTGP